MATGRQLIIERVLDREDLLAVTGGMSGVCLSCMDAVYTIMKYDPDVFDIMNTPRSAFEIFEDFTVILDRTMRIHATSQAMDAFASEKLLYADCARELFRQMTGGVLLNYGEYKQSRVYKSAVA